MLLAPEFVKIVEVDNDLLLQEFRDALMRIEVQRGDEHLHHLRIAFREEGVEVGLEVVERGHVDIRSDALRHSHQSQELKVELKRNRTLLEGEAVQLGRFRSLAGGVAVLSSIGDFAILGQDGLKILRRHEAEHIREELLALFVLQHHSFSQLVSFSALQGAGGDVQKLVVLVAIGCGDRVTGQPDLQRRIRRLIWKSESDGR